MYEVLLTKNMELIPSWEAASCAATQELRAFYGTQRFIAVSLSWARSIQVIPPHPISLRWILILSTHLCLGLRSGIFRQQMGKQMVPDQMVALSEFSLLLISSWIKFWFVIVKFSYPSVWWRCANKAVNTVPLILNIVFVMLLLYALLLASSINMIKWELIFWNLSYRLFYIGWDYNFFFFSFRNPFMHVANRQLYVLT
jgi:hypothetical protein